MVAGRKAGAAAGILAALLTFVGAPELLIRGAVAQTTSVEGQPAIGSRQDAELIATLIRSNLIGLHRAMVSGNYSVMRDLAAPSFRDRNTVADLALIFMPIRERRINLEAVAVLQPDLEAAVIDADGLLRIVGTFRTKPEPVRFELAFQIVDQSWALFGIRIDPLTELADTPPIRRSSPPIPQPRPNPVSG